MNYNQIMENMINGQNWTKDTLRENEAVFNKTQRVTHVGSWVWHIQQNQLQWSNEMYGIFGIKKENFNGNLADVIAQVIHPDDRNLVEQANRSMIEDKKPVSLEVRLILADGTLRVVWAEAGEPILNAEGQPVILMGIVQDITERRREEDKLQQWEQIFQNAVWGIAVGGTDGKSIELMNPAFAKMHGYTVEEMKDWAMDELFALQWRGNIAENIQLACQKGHHFWESRHVHKDGHTFPVLVDVTALKDKSGQVKFCLVNIQDMTGQKQAETALRESEAQYRQLFENMEEGFSLNEIIQDENGKVVDFRFLDINSAYRHHTGISTEVIGKTMLEIMPQADRRQIEAYGRVALTGEPFQFEYYSNTFHRHLRVKAFSLTKGRFAAVFEDITAAKLTETRLRESEQKYRMLFETSMDGILMTTTNGKLIAANLAACRMLGVTEAEILQCQQPEIVDTSDPRFGLAVEARAQTGVFTGELTYLRKDGTRFPVELTSVIYQPAEGDAQANIIFRDISQRKQAEQEKQKADARLRTLSVAIEQTPVTTVITDLTGNIVYVNPKFTESTGYTAEEVIGQNSRILKTGDTPDSEYKGMWETLLSGHSWHGVFHNKRKNGELYWESAVISPVKDVDGTITHFLAVQEDITERKRLEEELKKQAATDGLTGVTNRRYFLDLANRELKRAVRLSQSVAIVLIDLDHFKTINDTYGHAGGDQALLTFVKTCLKNIREIDVFARIGGDEFALLMPETSGEQAYTTVERIRQALAAAPMNLDEKPVLITISAGISSLIGGDEALDTLLGRADQALYQAKEAGRNRTIVEHTS